MFAFTATNSLPNSYAWDTYTLSCHSLGSLRIFRLAYVLSVGTCISANGEHDECQYCGRKLPQCDSDSDRHPQLIQHQWFFSRTRWLSAGHHGAYNDLNDWTFLTVDVCAVWYRAHLCGQRPSEKSIFNGANRRLHYFVILVRKPFLPFAHTNLLCFGGAGFVVVCLAFMPNAHSFLFTTRC